MDSQRMLLTGGAGFIGSHLAEALLHRKAQLTIVDSLDDFYSQDWKRAHLDEVHRAGSYEFNAVDICDIDSLRETMTRFRPESSFILRPAPASVHPSSNPGSTSK
jgi:UDP-glucuronate 4-epimerase